MPELPEVETVRRGLAPAMEGARIVNVRLNRPNLRFDFPHGMAARLQGAVVTALGRRAKYLLITLDNGRTVVSHLGMSGSWRVECADAQPVAPGIFHHPRGPAGPHDHVVLEVVQADGARFDIIYNDPRRFGFLYDLASDAMDRDKHLAVLGVEPTGNALSPDYLASRFAGKSAPLKAALLDQSIIAGLGNIYVCEALWRTKLSPKRKAATLVTARGQPTPRLNALAEAVRDVIAEAITAGGSSLRDHKQTDGTLGYFQHRFAAYDRQGEPCRHAGCGGTIKRIVQSGRSTFYCSACQR